MSSSRPKPSNISLWNRVKVEAKKKYKVWPSAYASGWLTKEYKKRGGKFQTPSKSRSRSKSLLTRWYEEKWIDVCYYPKKVPCGRNQSREGPYPYCRPSKRVSSKTPKLAKELKISEIKNLCRQKRKHPKSRSPIQHKRRRS
jgi:hypothetical protein